MAKKHCNSCHTMQPEEGGTQVPVNKGRRHRWMCAGCSKSRAESLKAIKESQNVATTGR